MTGMDLTAHPWAIHPGAMPVQLPEPPAGSAGARAAPVRYDGEPVGVLRCHGVVVPRCHAWLETAGYAVSCANLPGRVARAAEQYSAVVLDWNSPGGSVAGVAECAAAIAETAKSAKVVSVANYLIASAAYYIASSSSYIAVSPSALVGSVGVLTTRVSAVRALEASGYEYRLVTAGEGKADGHPATPITPAEAERLQAMVDGFYADFVGAAARGRGVPSSAVRDSWGAHLWRGADSVSLGMSDRVMSLPAMVQRLSTVQGRTSIRRTRASAAYTEDNIHTTEEEP